MREESVAKEVTYIQGLDGSAKSRSRRVDRLLLAPDWNWKKPPCLLARMALVRQRCVTGSRVLSTRNIFSPGQFSAVIEYTVWFSMTKLQNIESTSDSTMMKLLIFWTDNPCRMCH